MTNEIKKQSYHRDYLEKKAISLNSVNYFHAYKQRKNQVNKGIKQTKKYYSSKLAKRNNSAQRELAINNK